MKKENSNTFSFLFTKLQTTLRFQFHFTDCSSQIYTLRVIPKPLFNTFKIEITPPAYTRLQTQCFDFVNTLLVPEGSVVNFKLDCKNQSHCTVRSSSGVQFLKPGSASDYFYSHRLMEPQSLCFSIQNQSNPPIYDSLAISLQAIKDQAPGLEMEVVKDTLHSGWLYFNGTYLDDYGFSALKFNTNLQVPGMAPVIHSSLLEFNKNKGSHVFYHYMDVRSLNLPPGSKIQYYFSVSDNDAVHGPKTTRSQTFEYQLPGLNEQLEQQNLQNSQMDQALRQSLQQSQKIQRQMEQIKKEMSEKNEFDANDQKRMQSILEQYNQLQQSLETIQKKQAQAIENQTPETDSQLLERQKEIEKLLQQILTPELKKLIEEIKELMKQQNREAVSEKMEAFKFQQEDLQKV